MKKEKKKKAENSIGNNDAEKRIFGFIDTGAEARHTLLVVDIACTVILILAIMLVARFIMNQVFLSGYNKGKYDSGIESVLKYGNINEGYLPYYNSGNQHYKNEEYDEAIVDYERALTYYIPEGKECDIRVNLALAMLQKIDFDHIDTENEKEVKKVISQLLAAREVLTEVGCADPQGTDGHDEDAEQLKQDIDKMIQELQQYLDEEDQDDNQDQQDQQDQQDDQQNQQQNQQNQSQREKEVQEQLEKQKQENLQERNETQNTFNEQGKNPNGGGEEGEGEGGGEWNGKTW
ncbi:MAG: tetratricopeptide repeat protein [Eubacterium sp.]|nr:tetratricopeptide repeat protein [Eubacterium sp.]